MTILRRYLFKEVLSAVALSTGGFLFVMVVGNLVKEFLPRVVSGQLPWSDFFAIMLMLIPSVAPYVMPVGMLTGVLLVLGRLSAQNEITAMKASGLSLARITAPIVALGIAASFVAAAVNFEYAPRATTLVKARISGKVRGGNFIDYVPVKAPFSFNEGEVTLYVSSKDGGTLRDIWLWRADKTGRDVETVRAESGTISVDEGDPATSADDRVRLKLINTVVERRDRATPENISTFYSAVFEPDDIRADSLFRTGGSLQTKKIQWLTFPELMEARDKGYQVKPADSAEARFADRIKVQFQIQSNLANAFGILSLTLLAIPLGIRVARSETFVNMGVALGLALVYYFATVSFQWLRNPHLRPDILVWIPNIVIQIVAARLFLKASRT